MRRGLNPSLQSKERKERINLEPWLNAWTVADRFHMRWMIPGSVKGSGRDERVVGRRSKEEGKRRKKWN